MLGSTSYTKAVDMCVRSRTRAEKQCGRAVRGPSVHMRTGEPACKSRAGAA